MQDQRAGHQHQRDILLDVSRLVWRWWRGGVSTGVDRVCVAYVEHYAGRARAAVQWRGHYLILGPASSTRLFDLFLRSREGFRARFAALVARAFVTDGLTSPASGLLYLNVGHTGLHERSLPQWIERNALRAIYFVHDLIPLTHPEYCRPGEPDKHAFRIENALISATGVIGNSQSTIDELRAFATDRGLPMPPAVAAFIAGYAASARLAPAVLDRPYFIILGTIEGRKNHLLLLRIWERLALRMGDETPLLIVIGQRGWESAEAQSMLDTSPLLKRHVRELGSCTDEELADLLAGTRALLMPSFVEGYGLPVAEALAIGTPVIAGDLPVYREFAGDIPTYIDVSDIDGWEAMIVRFLVRDPERERQCLAIEHFKPPDWPAHFRRVDQWLAALPKGD